MAKEKSLKLRTIITLYALHKHSDRGHRLTPRKLNAFLNPYDLKITGEGLSDDIKIMQQFGLDAHTNEGAQAHSSYIGNHLFSDDILKKLVFAVSTNPHLSQSQATDILQQLKPLVTVYQEPLLQSFQTHIHNCETDDSLYWSYLVMKEAIAENRRVLYSVNYVKYNGSTNGIDCLTEWETLFTPAFIFKAMGKLYVLGYNNTDKKVSILDLTKLATVRLAPEYKLNKESVAKIKSTIPIEENPVSAIPAPLYEGPAVFRCFASNISYLYELFGEPSGPVEQAYNYRTTYSVSNAVITPDAIQGLAALSVTGGLQVIGPEPLRITISSYFDEQKNTLLSRSFPRTR